MKEIWRSTSRAQRYLSIEAERLRGCGLIRTLRTKLCGPMIRLAAEFFRSGILRTVMDVMISIYDYPSFIHPADID